MKFTFSELFAYFATILGLMLVMIILIRMKGKDVVKISLSAILLFTSLFVTLGTLTYTGKILIFPHLLRVAGPFEYLLGPACLFYTMASFKPAFRFRWIYLVNILPFLINIGAFIPFYLSGGATKIEYYHEYMNNHGTMVMPLHYLSKSILAILYFSLELRIFFKYRHIISQNSNTGKFTIRWFYIFFLGQAHLAAGLVIDNLTGLKLFDDPAVFSTIMLSLFLYSCLIALLFFPEILYGFQSVEIGVEVKKNMDVFRKEKYHYSTLNEVLKDTILSSLISYMMSGGKPFLDREITLLKVAEKLKVNPQHLSQVINEKTGLNFHDYINSFRVEAAKLILVSTEYKKLTIEAIANKVGFNSKSPFNVAFKKHTGITPSQFVNQFSSLPDLHT